MHVHRAMILVVPVLLLAACDDGSVASTAATVAPSSTTSPTTTTTTVPSPVDSAPATTTTVSEPSTTTEAVSAGMVIEVIVDGSGIVTGGGRVSVELGDEITLSVTSEVADEVHVHGFDLYLDLEPGITGELTFVADVPGVFEIELERSRVVLVDLEVGG
jgi:heme/copper-type cytochrome/quinol oxidase subunit 2